MKLIYAALFALSAATAAQAAFPTLYLKPVCTQQLHSPTNITTANDGSGRMFICEQQGKVMIFQNGMLLPTPFLDLTGSFVTLQGSPAGAGYDERGLLGMAFHPDYSNSASAGYRKFYIYYMKNSPNAPGSAAAPVNSMSVISEFQASATDPNVANLASERVLMSFDQPQFNHNGGQLEFGPDGLLYIGFGDGGSSNDNNAGHTGGVASPRPNGILGNGQDRRVLFGKILRIDPLGTNGPGGQYGIPPSNPFIGLTQDFTDNTLDGPMRGEIYAYGLRNPWRFSFDKRPGGTNRLFCGDVGQGKIEEINLITNGGNYGWRYREGTFVFDAVMSTNGIAPAVTTNPIAQYAHPGATGVGATPQLGLSVTGGYVYRGSAIPALQGKYLFGDYGATAGATTGRVMGLEETSPGSGTFTLTQTVAFIGGNPLPVRIQCMGEDESGELYFGTKITAGVLELSAGLPAGAIYKVMPTTSPGSTTLDAAADTVLSADNDNASNGVGPYLFAGNTAGGINFAPRRSLLKFDVSGLPAGAQAVSAALTLVENKTIVGAKVFTIHRVTAQWAEGLSDSGDPGGIAVPAQFGDATWLYSQVTNTSPYAGTEWLTPGGDFISSASASTSVNSGGPYTWNGSAMAGDVNAWIADPASNNGWLLKGPEVANTTEAKRFASKDYVIATDRPKLAISYAVPPAATPYETWFSTLFPTAPTGSFFDPTGDADGDAIGNLLEYAFALSPVTRNATNGLQFSAVTTTATAAFRRDPRATDLTYELQASDDLVQWDTIVTSTTGGTPTGPAFVSDVVISGEEPVRLVTATGTVTGGKTFIRLKITRTP